MSIASSSASLPTYYPPGAAYADASGAGAVVDGVPKVKKTRGRKRKTYEGSEDEKMPEGDITYEQKRELSDNINILPAEKLPLVFEIIKENAQLTVLVL